MSMNKTNKKKNKKKIREKKNLSISNMGDLVVIRNKTSISAGVSGIIILSLCIAGAVALKEAWKLPMFWVVFASLIAALAYSFVNIIFSKITLDSRKMQMTVYNPFKKQYKFEDINYVDVKTSNGKDGVVIHRVIVYIGDGKKSVEIATFSSKQADELSSLLRGMLDNGAMIYPEGNEEPFNFDDDKKEKKSIFSFGLKRAEKANTPDNSENDKEKSEEKTDKEEKSNSEAEDKNTVKSNE